MSEHIIKSGNEQQRFYPYSGMFYMGRQSFWSAGQDSWTQPPAQNPDLFQKLYNIEPVLQGTLQRRRGYQLLSTQAPSAPYTLGYSFRSESLGLRSIVYTSTANVLAINEDGSANTPTIFTPSPSALEPRMVLSRDFGYFADGVAADSLKWSGQSPIVNANVNNSPTPNNLTNWGINVLNQTGLTNGPNAPGTAAQSTTGASWANINNIKVSDGAFATVTVAGTSRYLTASNFGYAMSPNLFIVGVQVDIQGLQSGTNSGKSSMQVSLGSGSGFFPQTKTITDATFPTSNSFVSFGGPTDLWGGGAGQFQAAFFNNVASNVTIQVSSAPSINTAWAIDFVRITVFLAAGPLTVGAPVAGAITLQNGRTYFYAYQNSTTGHVSSLSPASVSTGAITAKNIPLSAIPTNADPQADTVLILATADGNDQTTLYLVAALPNGTATYTDSTPDLALLTQAIYLNTDQFGVIHGVANNNQPPLIRFPTKHKGRIYGAINSTLYFSKNLDEVTTANGLTTSKWEEAWPASNQLDVSEFAETIQGIMSDGETLWIATERCVRRLVGDSPQNFQKPEIQFNETGLLSMETWKVTFFEGQPVGTIWLTPDFRVMGSDFNTYKDIGTSVQDVLNSINVAAVGTIHAAFVANGPAEYYMLYVPTGGNTQPDTCLVYNIHKQQWSVWFATDLVTASLFFIDVAGLPRWTFAANAGSIYEWKSNLLQDRINNTPVSYTSTIRTSWLDFGESGFKKAMNQILVITDDSNLTVQISGAAALNAAQFTAPDVVLAATAVTAAPFGETFVPLAAAISKHKYYQFTFVSPAAAVGNVLAGYTVETIPLLRF